MDNQNNENPQEFGERAGNNDTREQAQGFGAPPPQGYGQIPPNGYNAPNGNNYQGYYGAPPVQGQGQYPPPPYGMPPRGSVPYQNYNGYQTPPMYQQPYIPPKPDKPLSSCAIISLVLGIVSIMFCCTGLFGLILASLSILFGVVGMFDKKRGNGMAIAGFICGLVSLYPAISVLLNNDSLFKWLYSGV